MKNNFRNFIEKFSADFRRKSLLTFFGADFGFDELERVFGFRVVAFGVDVAEDGAFLTEFATALAFLTSTILDADFSVGLGFSFSAFDDFGFSTFSGAAGFDGF